MTGEMCEPPRYHHFFAKKATQKALSEGVKNGIYSLSKPLLDHFLAKKATQKALSEGVKNGLYSLYLYREEPSFDSDL
jgi:hypothetical protein